jgi:DNA mismatch endonuclease, patch repair protein
MPRKLEHPGSTSEAQSAANRGVRRSDTKPEKAVRSMLHRLGYRFRKDRYLVLAEGAVRARPDIIFTKRRLAIFIDGCFWHLCPVHGRVPSSNPKYWVPKLEGNVRRDQVTTAALRQAGWTVLRFWEHVPPEEIVEQIGRVLRQQNSNLVL